MAQTQGRFKVACGKTKELVFSLNQYFETLHWKLTIQHYMESDLPKVCYLCRSEINPIYFHHRTKIRLGNEKLTDIMPICQSCFDRYENDKARRNGKKKSERFLLRQFGFNSSTLSIDDKRWLQNIHPHKRSHILSGYYMNKARRYNPSSFWINQQVKSTCKWIRKTEKEVIASLFQNV